MLLNYVHLPWTWAQDWDLRLRHCIQEFPLQTQFHFLNFSPLLLLRIAPSSKACLLAGHPWPLPVRLRLEWRNKMEGIVFTSHCWSRERHFKGLSFQPGICRLHCLWRLTGHCQRCLQKHSNHGNHRRPHQGKFWVWWYPAVSCVHGISFRLRDSPDSCWRADSEFPLLEGGSHWNSGYALVALLSPSAYYSHPLVWYRS